jgi:hypothetical protein
MPLSPEQEAAIAEMGKKQLAHQKETARLRTVRNIAVPATAISGALELIATDGAFKYMGGVLLAAAGMEYALIQRELHRSSEVDDMVLQTAMEAFEISTGNTD